MAIVKIRPTTRTKMAQQIVDDLDAGAGPSLLKFYTGAMPANPTVAVSSQVLLGTLTCSEPSATITDGVITFAAITQDAAADAGGTATWCRHLSSDGSAVNDYDVSDTTGSGAIKLNAVLIVQGGPIQMSSMAITIGGG
jgi:hypothetical protein